VGFSLSVSCCRFFIVGVLLSVSRCRSVFCCRFSVVDFLLWVFFCRIELSVFRCCCRVVGLSPVVDFSLYFCVLFRVFYFLFFFPFVCFPLSCSCCFSPFVCFLLSLSSSFSCLLSVDFLFFVFCLSFFGRFLLSVFSCRFSVVGSPLSVFYCRFPVVGFLSIS